MADFVYDNTSIPEGKSDVPGKSLSVPAGQKVTAAEWNTAMQAVKDVRTAVLTGKYHGLLDNPAEAVSGAAGLKLRNNGGLLEASEGGGAWRRHRGADYLHVDDFGAVGDGATDDHVAITAAIAAAAAAGRGVLFGAKTYAIHTALAITGGTPLDIRGTRAGSTVTTIKATASMANVLTVAGKHQFRDIDFEGSRLAADVVLCDNGSSYTVFNNCGAYNGLRHGFHVGSTGINDALTFTDCWSTYNGTYRHTATAPGISEMVAGMLVAVSGTVSTTAASAVVTGSGTSFLSASLDVGDLILVGASATELGEIVSVDSDTQITCAMPFAASRSSQQFGTLSGCGYAEARHNDTNINNVVGGLWRGNASAGLMIRGLYGTRVQRAQIDSNRGFGVICGVPGTGSPSYHGSIRDCYFEDNYAVTAVGSAFRINAIEGWELRGNMTLGSTEISYGSPTYAVRATLSTLKNVRNVGANYTFWSEVPSAVTHAAGMRLRGPLLAAYTFVGSNAGAALALSNLGNYTSDVSVYFYAAADQTVTATPSITPQTFEGVAVTDQIFRITNFNSVYALTLQDESVLSGSKLYLQRPTRTLRYRETLELVYVDGFFYELSFSPDNRPADSTAAPGNATQNTRTGRASVAIGAAAVTITNKLVTTTSIITAVLQSNDATLTQILRVVPTAGSFTITGNANATAAANVAWHLVE